MVEIKIQKQDSVKLYKIRKALKELTSISGFKINTWLK